MREGQHKTNGYHPWKEEGSGKRGKKRREVAIGLSGNKIQAERNKGRGTEGVMKEFREK